MAVVVDASALAYALLGRDPSAHRLRRRLVEEEGHAPHLVDAEVGNVLRRRVRRGQCSARDAGQLLAAAAALIDHRYEMTGALARAAWERRENLSFYDALYVSLAKALGAPLITSDGRLARSPALGCAVELIASAP